MPPKLNPLRLNNLQLKTLVLLQELARHPQTATRDEATGEVLITMIPQPHGNHIHVGASVAQVADATGLWNENVWRALQRKGLAVGEFPIAVRLTQAGLNYDAGPAKRILHGSDH